ELVVDPRQSLADLGRLLDKASRPPVETTFTVVNGVPQPKLGAPGQACCADAAPGIVQQALMETARAAGGPARPPLQLPLRPVPPRVTADKLPGLGVKEQVATFTTRYPAGQPRVTNIHRIADLVKGSVVLPGETFS